MMSFDDLGKRTTVVSCEGLAHSHRSVHKPPTSPFFALDFARNLTGFVFGSLSSLSSGRGLERKYILIATSRKGKWSRRFFSR